MSVRTTDERLLRWISGTVCAGIIVSSKSALHAERWRRVEERWRRDEERWRRDEER